MRTCPYCKEEVKGRLDKKFCNPYCKSSYHYEKSRDDQNNLYLTIDRQLKNNRRLLKKYNNINNILKKEMNNNLFFNILILLKKK